MTEVDDEEASSGEAKEAPVSGGSDAPAADKPSKVKLKDKWEKVGGQWQRVHVKARRSLCDPATFLDGPDKSEIGGMRITKGEVP